MQNSLTKKRNMKKKMLTLHKVTVMYEDFFRYSQY